MTDATRRYRSVPGLAELGDGRISYAERSMPLLSALATRFRAERPFDGMVIAASVVPIGDQLRRRSAARDCRADIYRQQPG